MKCDNIVIKLSLTLMIKNIIICLCTCALFAGVQVCSCKRRRNVTACAVQYMDNNKNNVSRKASGNTASVVAIIVVGIFVLCVILLLAKGLFASNSSEVPKGINTATINTNESVAEPVNSAAPADTSVTGNSSVDESGAVTDSPNIVWRLSHPEVELLNPYLLMLRNSFRHIYLHWLSGKYLRYQQTLHLLRIYR